MGSSLSSSPSVIGWFNAFAIITGSELGRSIATSAQWTAENVIAAEDAGMVLGNTLMAAASDTLFPEAKTFVKVTSVVCSLLLSSFGGFASARARLGEAATLSRSAIDTTAKWGVAGLVAGGALATIGTIALHPAAGPLLGGTTCFLINKYVTLHEAQKDQLLQRT